MDAPCPCIESVAHITDNPLAGAVVLPRAGHQVGQTKVGPEAISTNCPATAAWSPGGPVGACLVCPRTVGFKKSPPYELAGRGFPVPPLVNNYKTSQPQYGPSVARLLI